MDSSSLLFLKTDVYPIYRKFITSEMSSIVTLNYIQVRVLQEYIHFLATIYGDNKIISKFNIENCYIDLNNFIPIFEIMEGQLERI